MKITLVATLFVAFFACNKESKSNIETEKEQVKTTLVKMCDAIEKEDIEKYAQYIHPNFTQFGETDSVLLIGKNTEIAGTSAWVQDAENIHTEMLEPRVTIIGDVAWITYYWLDSPTLKTH